MKLKLHLWAHEVFGWLATSKIVLEEDYTDLILAISPALLNDDYDLMREIKHLSLFSTADVYLEEANKYAHWIVNKVAKVKKNLNFSSSLPLPFHDFVRKDQENLYVIE